VYDFVYCSCLFIAQALVADGLKVLKDKSHEPRKAFPSKKQHTLFGCDPGLLIINEAAEMRNMGNKFNAAMGMAKLVKTTILLTATPVITRTTVNTSLCLVE
jgi:hypothetical protein